MVIDPQDVVAIIPARGGSKGVPRKNLRRIGGVPLISYAIENGLRAETVGRVIVSSDDDEIREAAIDAGAEAPFVRPASLATDNAVDLPVILHAVDWLEHDSGRRPKVVVQLRPTTPLRPEGLVDEAVRRLIADPEADCVRGVSAPETTPYKMWRRSADGSLSPLLAGEFVEPYNMPRQELPEVWRQTGHVDAIRVRTIDEQRSLTGRRVLPIEIPERFGIDIDSESDLEHAAFAITRLGDEVVRPGVRPPSSPDLVVLDFDGVLTDNRVFVDRDGLETVACSRADGLGVAMIRKAGITIAVLSSERDPVVAARCEKLAIPCFQGVADKGDALRQICRSHGAKPDRVVYIGNDLNDLPAFEVVGWPVAVADAAEEVRRRARWVLASAGGHGAVRELAGQMLGSAAEALGRETEARAASDDGQSGCLVHLPARRATGKGAAA